jgi:hypothetical protein
MIRMVIDVRYVLGVRMGLTLLNELDSRGYELWIRDGSMEVLHSNIAIIWDTCRGGLLEMIGMVGSASTIVSTDTHTCRVVSVDVMTCCSRAMMVETCYMIVSFIVQLFG